MERRALALGLAASAAVLAGLGLPLLWGQVWVQDDLGVFHLMTRYIYARSLTSGANFSWARELFGGFYIHGEGQAGMVHPIHLALYRMLPFVPAFHLDQLLTYPFALGGAFVFLRRWRLRRDAALLGAVVFAFGGYNMFHFVHPNQRAVAAHLPWLLLAIEGALCDADPRRAARARLAAALLTTSQLLLGHPQVVWLSALTEVLYVSFRATAVRGPGRLVALGGAKLLGLLGGSIQLLPTWTTVFASTKGVPGTRDPFRVSLDPANLVQPLAPYLAETRAFGTRFPHEFGLYCGAAATVLVAWLLIRWKTLGRDRRLAKGALGLAALALVLALGENGYLYRLQASLPLVGLFEAPVRYILLVQLGVGLAAAIAFADLARLAESGERSGRRALWALAALPAASALVAAAALWLRAHPGVAPGLAAQLGAPAGILAGPALLLAASGLVAAAARGARWALPALVVFAGADQGFYGVSFLWRLQPPITIAQMAQGQAKPPEPPEPGRNRVHSRNNYLVLLGYDLTSGYAAFGPVRQLDELSPERLRLAGARWVQVRRPWDPEPAPTPSGEELHYTYDALGRASSWRRVDDPMPRARLVAEERVSGDPRRDIEAVDVGAVALVPEALGLEGGVPGSVSVARDRPGDIELVTRTPARQLVVLTESWHQGWRAWVDGEPRPVVRVDGDFVGCAVDAGSHRVRLQFRPASLRWGARLTAVALGLMLVSFLASRRRHPGAPGPPGDPRA